MTPRPTADAMGQSSAAGDSSGTGSGQPLRIGDLARQTGVTVETLRYYERRRLIRPTGRRRSGYREYAPAAVGLVRFIKRAQSLGFTLAEVEELVGLRERAWAGDATLRLRDAIVAKVDDIDRRVGDLRELGNELGTLIAACDAACAGSPERVGSDEEPVNRAGGVASGFAAGVLDCPLVEALDTEADSRGVRTESTPKASRQPVTAMLASAGTASDAKGRTRRKHVQSNGGSHDSE
ncbi:MAG: MerR family transcriptional regulator [Longimicrobiales bacterium]